MLCEELEAGAALRDLATQAELAREPAPQLHADLARARQDRWGSTLWYYSSPTNASPASPSRSNPPPFVGKPSTFQTVPGSTLLLLVRKADSPGKNAFGTIGLLFRYPFRILCRLFFFPD